MSKINLKTLITEVDGKTPFSFGRNSVKDENGEMKQVHITATYQSLLNDLLRRIRSNDNEAKLSGYALALKVYNHTDETDYTPEDIEALKKLLLSTSDVIYGQFVALL